MNLWIYCVELLLFSVISIP
uniref:Uncharacterized protein n=1 Tax=Rhizophora mucronata TaxID=61149 RepID=A0A2P2ITK4_RHIMU